MSEILKTVEFDQEVRRYDDVSTWLAEVLPGQMRSEFSYTFDGEDLRARDGSNMRIVFDDAIEEADSLAARNPELSFEKRRRLIEMDEYEDMVAMARGDAPNTMVVVSDFPAELMGAKEDVGGYNSSRKQTMLRVITKQADGTIRMVTQSLDQSNRSALEAMYGHLYFTPQYGELLGQRMKIDLDQDFQNDLPNILRNVYDKSLTAQKGGEWCAGRRPDDVRNTLSFVRSQTDLLQVHLRSDQSDQACFNLAAAMEARFTTAERGGRVYISEPATFAHISVAVELELAGRQAAAQNKTYSGCGASVSGNAEGEFVQSGYGNKSLESVGPADKFGPLTFECPKGHKNTRPRNQLIECCKTCGVSVKC